MAIKHFALFCGALFFTIMTHPMSVPAKIEAVQSASKNDLNSKVHKEKHESLEADTQAIAIRAVLSTIHVNEIAQKEKTESDTAQPAAKSAAAPKSPKKVTINVTDSPPLGYQGFASQAGTTASLFSESLPSAALSIRWNSPVLFP